MLLFDALIVYTIDRASFILKQLEVTFQHLHSLKHFVCTYITACDYFFSHSMMS